MDAFSCDLNESGLRMCLDYRKKAAMKKILILGANMFQTIAIKKAKELGYYVICAAVGGDLPGKDAADEFFHISSTDKYAILDLARRKKVDGILAYATDVAAPTAAYVSERLHLPTNPYDAVKTLTNKGKFREFMERQGYLAPKYRVFTNKEEARQFLSSMELPVILKPVDSSGSKGVAVIRSRDEFDLRYDEAVSYSLSGCIIIEEYIVKEGYQIDGDGFVKDGKIEFLGILDQHNHIELNPHAPIGLSYPSIQEKRYQEKAFDIMQGIFTDLGIRFGAFNYEYIIHDGKVYLLEIGMRNGGNLIPDTVFHATGVDMTEASIRACVGDDYTEALRVKKQGIATSYVIHSSEHGYYEGIEIDPDLRDHVLEMFVSAKEGEEVYRFRNASDDVGAMVLSFDDVGTMCRYMDEMWNHVRVKVKQE